ncbi:MAG: alpha-ketoglutarate-dependent dioxygenase AlkB [Burkholderiaceae bacterium]
MTLSGLSGSREPIEIQRDVVLLPARGSAKEMLAPLQHILNQSPWRHMTVPGGKKMSVANTNCGTLGWTSDTHGYAYSKVDPLSGSPWPRMPDTWRSIASAWCAEAGFATDFSPDVCLINGYAMGARMSAHQDRDELDAQWPIVSLSLGASARFVMGGGRRTDKGTGIMLSSGDVLIWGRSARMNYHGVGVPRQSTKPLPDLANLPFARLNFTFRRAA